MSEINNNGLIEKLNEEVSDGIDNEVLGFVTKAAFGELTSYKEILSSLIISASSIRNTNVLSRVMYAQIDAQLRIWDGYIEEHRLEFTQIMEQRESVLDTFRNILTDLSETLPKLSGEDASNCVNLIEKIISSMAVVGINVPELIQPPHISLRE